MPIPVINTKSKARSARTCAHQILVAVGHVREFGTPDDAGVADRMDAIASDILKAVEAFEE